MADIKTLIIGTSRGGWKKGRKGDLWAITPGDYGTAETAPDWVQLTITGAPDRQAVEQYLVSMATGFDYLEVTGASVGEQRYRVEVKPELDILPNPIFLAARDGVTARFATTGTYENQSPRRWFTFDSQPGLPLDEIEFEMTEAIGDSRRYQLSDNYVDNLLGGVAVGDPAADTQTWAWLQTNIVDKLG